MYRGFVGSQSSGAASAPSRTAVPFGGRAGRGAMAWRRAVVALLAVLLPLLAAATLEAQEAVRLTPELERAAQQAMSRLRSPYTGSHTVDMCPSAGALRDSIRVAVAGGQSPDQVVEDVIGRHGEHLRLLPKRSGAGLWAWIIPPLVILAGAALIAVKLRGRQSTLPPASAGTAKLGDADRERVAAALRNWEANGEVEP